MSETRYDNAIRRQVWSLPELLLQQYDDLEPKTRKLLSTPQIFSLRRIVLTGCGDSYAAALAAQSAFERLTGLPVETVGAIDAARFMALPQPGGPPNTPLLIAVSHSGQVARVAEAAMRFGAAGALTAAVTSRPDSMLGRAAAVRLDLNVPPFESAPGVRTYAASLLALLLLAIRIGEVRGRYTMDQATAYRSELRTCAAAMEATLSATDDLALELASAWQMCTGFDFIGAGPEYASAWFGHAKLLEATGRYALHTDTEHWLHLNFFLRQAASTGTLLIVESRSPSLSRAVETAGHIRSVGRPFAVLTDADPGLFPEGALLVPLPRAPQPWMSPLLQSAAPALLAGYLAELLGEEYGRGAKDNWSACRDGATTRDSEIVVLI